MSFTYTRLVVRHAIRLFKQRSRDWGRHVMGFAVQTAILFAILYYLPWLGDVQEQGRLAAAGIASVIGSVVLSFLWDVIRAPQVIWRELSDRLSELERAVQPKFSVLTNQIAARQINYPTVQRSPYTGSTKLILQQPGTDVLALDVRNETAVTLKGCEGYLSNFWEIGGEDSAFESLRLQWIAIGDELYSVDIPASGHRTLIAFRVTANRVSFVHDRLTLDMFSILKDDGHYCGVIALTAQNTATSYVGFELQCFKDSDPHFRIIRRGFQDAELIPWVRETIRGLGF